MAPWFLGPDEHERHALRLEHPFAGPPVTELDIAFAIDAYCAKGLSITSVRRRRLRLLRRLSVILEPLDTILRDRRHVKIASAPGVRPVYAAVLITLMRWPDRGLATNLAEGFELAGPSLSLKC